MSSIYSTMVRHGMLDNKYTKWYFGIISSYQPKTIPENIYCENHHIMPKCIEKNNSSENIIRVRMKDHVILHHLLTKMFEGEIKQKMCLAYCSIITSSFVQSTPRQIEYTKYMLYITSREWNQKRSHSMKEKWRNEKHPMQGHKQTEEAKMKIGNSSKGRFVGEKSSRTSYTNNEIFQIKNDPRLYEWGGIKTMAELLSVKRSFLSDIKTERRWKHIPLVI